METTSEGTPARRRTVKRVGPRGRQPGHEGRAAATELALRNLTPRSSATVVKRSVSLDADLDTELTKRFGRGGKSRFLNTAARDALARLLLVELLDRMEGQDGPIPDEIRTEVA